MAFFSKSPGRTVCRTTLPDWARPFESCLLPRCGSCTSHAETGSCSGVANWLTAESVKVCSIPEVLAGEKGRRLYRPETIELVLVAFLPVGPLACRCC